ncbi:MULTISPECIES: DUF4926 domain-containing protein [Aerosakkonema]|uniref:DUF4926 domain-containing protein n=1 Tax=Aerosakkonema TaxID=1246629 RepID=UPI0035B907BE
MNLYFLVEGNSTEKKVYPAWLAHILPELQRVQNYNEVVKNNYYLFSGGGYPSIYDHITNAIEDILSIGKYDYFVVCLDAEERTVSDSKQEIYELLQSKNIDMGSTQLVIIIQNRCIETWFLGNRKIYSRNPQTSPLLDYTSFYDVSVNCPELMGKYDNFNNLRAGDVGTVVERHDVPGLATGYSVEFFDMLGSTIAVATLPGSMLRAPTHTDIPSVRSEVLTV